MISLQERVVTDGSKPWLATRLHRLRTFRYHIPIIRMFHMYSHSHQHSCQDANHAQRLPPSYLFFVARLPSRSGPHMPDSVCLNGPLPKPPTLFARQSTENPCSHAHNLPRTRSATHITRVTSSLRVVACLPATHEICSRHVSIPFLP